METDAARELLGKMAAQVPDVLISFGTALDSAGMLVDGWAYFLEKPWKWAYEYTTWQEHGAPAHAPSGLWGSF